MISWRPQDFEGLLLMKSGDFQLVWAGMLEGHYKIEHVPSGNQSRGFNKEDFFAGHFHGLTAFANGGEVRWTNTSFAKQVFRWLKAYGAERPVDVLCELMPDAREQIQYGFSEIAAAAFEEMGS